MIPCKFFMKGHCRYGEMCRFSHQTNNQYNPNPFASGYQKNPIAMSNFGNYSQQNNYAQQAQQSRSKIDESLRVIEEAVKKDMIEWERGKIWPFSSYGPIGGKPNLPGFDDLSAEELRYATLQNAGQPPSDIAMRFSQWNGYRSNYQVANPSNRQILHQISMVQPPQQSTQLTSSPFQAPSSNIASVFGGAPAPSFGAATSFSSNSQLTSPFMGGGMNSTPAFSSMSPNIFGLNNSSSLQTEQMEDTGPVSGNSSLPQFSFNQVLSQTQQQQQQPSSVFGNPGPFSSPTNLLQAPNPTPFGAPQFSGFQAVQAPQPAPNVSFGFNSAESSFAPASNSVFGMSQPITLNNSNMMTSNIFGGGGSGGGGDSIGDDFSIYSKDTDLTDHEIRAYEHTSFEIDTLPLHAPSKRFCC